MSRFTFIVTFIALASLPTACAPTPTVAPPTARPTAAPTYTPVIFTTPTPAPNPTPQPEPLKIGLLTDSSGTLAVYGAMLEKGLALGLEFATDGTHSIAGHPLQVIVKDTASKTSIGAQAVRDLLEKDNVDLLVGAPSASVTLAAAELAKQSKRILIVHPAAGTEFTGKNFNPYVFRASRATSQDALALGVALNRLGKKFIQIAPDNAFGYGAAAGFYAAVKANGGQFVVNDSAEKSGTLFIPPDTRDFASYLQKVKDAKGDVLIVTWTGAGFITLFTQMQQLGVFNALSVVTGMGDNHALKAGATPAVGSLGLSIYHYTLPKNPINGWLVTRHKEKFNSPPDIFTEGGFVAAQMIVAGLKATNGDASADQLIPVLEKLSFDGPKGRYTVRESDHLLLQTLYLVKLTNTTDADFKFFDLVQELKPEETAPPCALEGEYKSRCP